MSYLIDQEAWLAFYAERLGVSVENLGDRDVRLAHALYHGAYLPTAASLELRFNELDMLQRYAEFGFEPNTPSFAVAKVRVTLPSAPVTGSYTMAAPFVVTQGNLRFVAAEPLTIAQGETVGEAEIVAEMQGADGTPQEAAASITVSVGWLRGAAIEITDVTPGRDGDSAEKVRSDFRAYAFNPQALVRAEDHAAWIEDNDENAARAMATARVEVTFNGSVYSKTDPAAGHLTLAIIAPGGTQPDSSALTAMHSAMMLKTVPYGTDRLHLVPAAPLDIDGTIAAVIEPGLDQAEVKSSILDAIEQLLDWQTWPHRRHVYSGDIWGVVNDVVGVRYATSILLNGALLDGTPDTTVAELEPWEYPRSVFVDTDITLTEAT